ncbi:centromere protein H isoform X1 [Coturnix japonica]|uniref:Centromere protein H n=1 Tax=Coturnix japonica TaxID=93934 RepID=A0A8C2Y8X6_COTJA|nr:centromere protein H isoform X1 [Coturnix japonica]
MAARLKEPSRLGASAAAVAADPNAKDAVKQLCEKSQVKQLVMEFSTACPQDEECNRDVEADFAQSADENLEEVDKVKTAFESKALVLQRIQLMDALRKKMKQNDDSARKTLETVRDIVNLNWKILQAHQETRAIREELNDIRRKRYALKQSAVKAMQTFTTTKNKKEVVKMTVTDKLKLIHKNLQHEKKMTVLLQHILQNLILGCQINWAKDPSLKAVVLQAEKDFTIRNLF